MDIGGERNVALAQAIATWAHTGQVDKNGYDYIDHPRAVFYRVFADDQWDYDGQVVAWLHDVVEDTDLRLTELASFFPYHILMAVGAITFKSKVETRDEYYARVKANPIALRVKLHDIAHNTSPKRMDNLPLDVRARLKAKYAHALEVLLS